MKSDRNSTTEKSEYREKHHGQGACAAAHHSISSCVGAGYLFLTEKITAGERQIADGQRQLEQGQSALEVGKEKLEVGKEKLEVGKRELAEGKKEYKQAKDNPFVVLADKLLRKGLQGAREQIAEGDKQVAKGDKQVAKGEGQVTDGKRRLDAGELELRRGREQLRLAKGARALCGRGAFLPLYRLCSGSVGGDHWPGSLCILMPKKRDEVCAR